MTKHTVGCDFCGKGNVYLENSNNQISLVCPDCEATLDLTFQPPPGYKLRAELLEGGGVKITKTPIH